MNVKNKIEFNKLISKMKIKGNSVVINQCPDMEKIPDNIDGVMQKFYSYKEKGLSKSRNKAIEKCQSDIFLIADDDMQYVNNYENIVRDAYEKYKDADIIAFYVSSDNKNNIKPKLKEGKINFLTTFKLQSVQLSFKTESIKSQNIKFDENFGAGSELYMGEENIFLIDCLKSKLKIYSYPVEIARLTDRESTWFSGYTSKYFQVKGACFSRISKHFWLLLFIQFVLRKRKEYINTISTKSALKNMFIGRKNYLKFNK